MPALQRPRRAPVPSSSLRRLAPAAHAAAPACAAVFEPLEERRLFAAVYPTPQEQYLLQLINRARADPQADVNRQVAAGRWNGTPQTLDEGVAPGTYPPGPRQPWAMNPFLLDAARKHTQWLQANPGVSPDGHTEIVNGQRIGPSDRMTAAGYVFAGQSGGGENVWTTATSADELADLLRLQQEPLNDWNATGGVPGRGHRGGLLSPNTNEVGLGIAKQAPWTQVTMNFANAGRTSFLCGVAIKDLNNDQFYQPGEQLGGVTITATRTSDNKVFSTTTWDSGGYSLPIEPGTYNVVATGGDIGAPAPKTATVTTQNVAADFVQTTATLSAPAIVTQPVDARPRTSATQFSFSVSATGNPVPTVQWQSAPFNTTTFTDVPGATAYTYTGTIAGTPNGTQYRAVLTNSQGTATSTAGTLFIPNGTRLPITVTVRPKDQTVNAGDTVTFTVAATGYTTLKWYYTTPTSNAPTDVPGATTPTLTFVADASMSGRTYWADLGNPSGGQSIPAKLTVNAIPTAPAVVTQPPPTTTTTPAQPAQVETGVTGFPAPDVTLQQQDPDDGSWGDFAPDVGDAGRSIRPAAVTGVTVAQTAGGVVTLSFPVTAADNKKVLRAVISNGEGSVTTAPFKLAVNDKLAVSNDLRSLKSAVGAALDAVEACRKATAAQVKTLSRDLKRLGASKEAKAALATLAADEKSSRAAFLKNQKAFLGTLKKLATAIDKDARRLAKRPGDATLQARLQANVTALQTAAAASTAPADATACKLAQTDALDGLLAVAPDDADLRAHVYNAGQNANNISQTLQTPVAIAQVIVARLVGNAQGA